MIYNVSQTPENNTEQLATMIKAFKLHIIHIYFVYNNTNKKKLNN